MGFSLTDAQIARFRDDGFVIVDRIISPERAKALAASFEGLFRGDFETGLYPDEWNWREGRDSPDLTRQICNGWKADRGVASVVLDADVGRACARLADWSGARIYQDNVLWKPPGAKALGFHQDNSYVDFVVPGAMVTCWIALDDTSAAGGTVEHAPGSHRWRHAPPIAEFHGPDDPKRELRAAAEAEGASDATVAVEVPAGGGAFHHGWTWHGSALNRGDRPRRSVVAHCIAADARFHEGRVGYIYSRYKRYGDTAMDESFFPILWTEDGRRSPFLDRYIAGELGPGGISPSAPGRSTA